MSGKRRRGIAWREVAPDDPRWQQFRVHVGEDEWRRLWRWVRVRGAVATVVSVLCVIVVLGALYNIGTALRSIFPSTPLSAPEGEDWPLLPAIAWVLFWACLVISWLMGKALDRAFSVAWSRGSTVSQSEPDMGPESLRVSAAETAATRELGDTIQALDEQWTRVRNRLGEKEWRELVRWRRMWVGLIQARFYSLLVTVFYVLMVVVDIAASGTPGDQLRRHLAWHPVQIAPFLAILSAIGAWAIARLIFSRFERLWWGGYHPESMEQALWAEEAAQALRQHQIASAQETAALSHLETDGQTVPPWWRIELSGAHLVWWLSTAAFIVDGLLGWPVPIGLALALGLVVFPWGLAKVIFWVLYANTTYAARVRRIRFYRWWGRGWLPAVIALSPALLALLGHS